MVEDGARILSNVVVNQIDIFAEYGGVIPEVAARSHLEAMIPVVNKALSDASCTWNEIDAIAVTHAPGLLGSLLVGTLTARTLAILHNKPLYAVHHLKSHVYANWLDAWQFKHDFSRDGVASARRYGRSAPQTSTNSRPLGVVSRQETCFLSTRLLQRSAVASGSPRKVCSELPLPTFPLLALVVSGGHTQILYMRGHNQFEIIGTTKDDAVGECFDKVAKILGLPYPGGPSIAKVALLGDAQKYQFPHPKVEGLDFSFSGLKTAVLRAVQKEVGVPISYPSHKLKELLIPQQVADFAASFQKTAVDILVEKLMMALEKYPDVQSVVVAGGVSANEILREALPEAYFPAPALSGDNGAMVAAAAYYEIQSGVEPTDPYSLNIYPRISIES